MRCGRVSSRCFRSPVAVRGAAADGRGSPSARRSPGILFVLRGGLPWQMLPREMGCGSGSTFWRRLVEWERAVVWRRLHETLLAELRRRGRLDQRRTVVDSGSVRAMRGGKELDRTQPIAARRGPNTTS